MPLRGVKIRECSENNCFEIYSEAFGGQVEKFSCDNFSTQVK